MWLEMDLNFGYILFLYLREKNVSPEIIERQVKRLDQRLTRLETPYANTSNINNNEPDNNMYMM